VGKETREGETGDDAQASHQQGEVNPAASRPAGGLGFRQHRALVKLQETVAVGTQFIELRFEPREIFIALALLLISQSRICRPRIFLCAIYSREKSVEHLVVGVAVAAYRLNNFRLALFRDVVRRFLKVRVEPRTMLAPL